MVMIVVLLGAGVFLLNDLNFNRSSQTSSPRVLEPRIPGTSEPIESSSNPPSTVSDILDFEEVHRFNSIEEIGKIRFTMTVGKVYRIQTRLVYHYQGFGKILVKDYDDPEYTKEYRYIVQVGYPWSIGGHTPLKGRHYSVIPIEVGPTVLKLRIEDIKE